MAVCIFYTLCNKCPSLLDAIHKNVLISPCLVQKSSLFTAFSPSWIPLPSFSLNLELTSTVQHASLHPATGGPQELSVLLGITMDFPAFALCPVSVLSLNSFLPCFLTMTLFPIFSPVLANLWAYALSVLPSLVSYKTS